jgi:Transposase IS4
MDIIRNRNVNLIGEPEDVIQVMGVLEVDNDNEPAPENVLIPNDITINDCVYREWGHGGTCFRKMENARDVRASTNFPSQIQPGLVDLFEMLFPKNYITDKLLVAVNNNTKMGSVKYGEFLQFLGIWFLMATIKGPSCRNFWSHENVNLFHEAPFRVNVFMSRNRFEDILYALQYTLNNPPGFNTKFFEIERWWTRGIAI